MKKTLWSLWFVTCCLLCLFAVSLIAGCSTQTQTTTTTSCDNARTALKATVLVLNAAIIVEPNKFSSADINEIQFWVNAAQACIDEYCADPNNPLFLDCENTALSHLDSYSSQTIKTSITLSGE